MSEDEAPRIDIRQYAIVARTLTIEEFESSNESALVETLAQLQKVNFLRFQAVVQDTELGLGTRFHAFAIAGSAFDILISALHMVRQRRPVEGGALMRVALEAACTAIQIFQDSNAFERYRAGTFQPTKSVSYAKQVIPIVGQLSGALSQVGVHVNAATFGVRHERSPSGKVVGRIESYYGVRPPATNWQDEAMLALVSLCALIVLKAHETILMEAEPRLPGWSRLAGTDFGYLHGTEAAIDRLLEKLAQYGLS